MSVGIGFVGSALKKLFNKNQNFIIRSANKEKTSNQSYVTKESELRIIERPIAGTDFAMVQTDLSGKQWVIVKKFKPAIQENQSASC